jgi:8-oxo-dGTP diphosphatase
MFAGSPGSHIQTRADLRLASRLPDQQLQDREAVLMSQRRQDPDVRRAKYRGEIFQDGRFAQADPKGPMSAQATTVPDVSSTAGALPKGLPRIGSAVIVIDGDAVLLGIRGKEPHQGKWVIPGGKVRPFESIDEAARREIREETGLEIAVESQLGVWEIIEPPAEHRVIVYSIARPVGGELRASSDLAEVRYWSIDEVEHLDLTPTVRSVLHSALNR